MVLRMAPSLSSMRYSAFCALADLSNVGTPSTPAPSRLGLPTTGPPASGVYQTTAPVEGLSAYTPPGSVAVAVLRLAPTRRSLRSLSHTADPPQKANLPLGAETP